MHRGRWQRSSLPSSGRQEQAAAGSCPSLLWPSPSSTCNIRNARRQQMGNVTAFLSLLLPQGQRLGHSCSTVSH